MIWNERPTTGLSFTPYSTENIMVSKLKSVTEFKLIIERGIAFNSGKRSLDKTNLSEILKYYEFLEKEIPSLKIKWVNN